jgi:hypothetical protein
VARRNIRIVTFNQNEEAAVDALFDDLLMSSAWSPARTTLGARRLRRPYGADEWRVEHVPLKAQGNVSAAVELANFFATRDPAYDSVVFYGCAGAVTPGTTASVFLVESAQYLSLGKVRPGIAPGQELVTLNNKWLCHLRPAGDAMPLPPVTFPLCATTGISALPALTRLPVARVAATDKVVTVPVSVPPNPVASVMAGNEYAPEQWSYGQALGLMVATSPNPVIVDMESYGIGRLAHALSMAESVTILRVTTDALTDHARSDAEQLSMLVKGRVVLAHVLRHLFSGLVSAI